MYRWTTTARNDAAHSENLIHDDAVAQQYGFKGGLVPGVTVYAIGTRPLVDQWGRALLERGCTEFRLPAPVYEGEQVEAIAYDGAGGAGDSGASDTFQVRNGTGDICLAGTASLPDRVTDFPEIPVGGELPRARPDASEHTLAPGTVLAPVVNAATEGHREFVDLIGDDHPLWHDEGLVHPGWLARAMNEVLSRNVLLGPWIHVGSTIAHHGPAYSGEVLETRGVVVDNFDRRGHRFVTANSATVVQGSERPVLSAVHTAIWKPRALG